MNKMENIGMELSDTADQQDAFMAGWDDSDTAETADQPSADTDGEAADEEDYSEDAEAGDDEAREGEADTQAEQQEAEETRQDAENGESREAAWIIKHNGTELTVKAGDITPELLQKGVDYDRIRTKYDEAKPAMEIFSGLAQSNGMSVPEYIRVVRAAMKKAEGMNDEEAARAIDLEDREAAVSEREAEQQEADRQNERIVSDLNEFANAFPEIYKQAETNPEAIPKAVWEDVRRGLSLTAAYARYAVASANDAAKTAQAQAAATELNRKNGARSAGSMQSAGNDSKQKDAFLIGWDS